MEALKIENFRFGLDKRRTVLTSQLGTLEVATNGHLNAGGEIESRKAFIRTDLPAGTFGLEATTLGIYTFGSGTDPGGWPIGNVVGYQRLQHPAVLDGASYDAAKHAMTGVVFSCPFNGLAFVCAMFADTYSFLYYNGTLIEQSRRGMVLSAFTSNANLATQLAATLTGIDGFHALASSNTVDLWSDFGIDYVPLVDELISASGTVSIIKVSDFTEGTPGVAAIGRFTVVAFSTTGSITTITVNGVTINADAIPCTGLTTNAEVAAAIAAEINESVSTPKYTASSSAGTVFIHAGPDEGTAPNGFVVVVTTTKVCIGLCASALPTGAVDGDQCTSVEIDPGNIEILGATITKAGTVASWAAAIAAQIVTFNTAYTSVSVGEVVYISRKITSSANTAETATFNLSAGTVIDNPPGIPQDPTIGPSIGNIQTTWALVAGATDYNIYRSTSLLGDYEQIGTVADPTVLWSDVTIVADVRYFYKITAVNEVGESGFSSIVSGSYPATSISFTFALLIDDSTPSVTLNVAPSTSYQVRRGNSPGTTSAYAFFNAGTYVDTDVSTGIPYYYILVDAATGEDSTVLGALINGALPEAPFTVQLSRLSLFGNSTSEQENILVTTNDAVKVIVSGGVQPFSFVWTEVNNPNGIYPTDPDGNDTKFRVSVPKGQTYFATFRCLVTGGGGNQEFSPEVTISLGHRV